MNAKRFIRFFQMIVMAGIIIMLPGKAALAQQMPYSIAVDLTNHIVTVYSNNNRTIVRQCLCTSGAEDSTPVGIYTMPEKERDDERTEWYYFRSSGVYGKYATRVYKGIMFHSILYNRKSMSSVSQKAIEEYGSSASHGCLRLRWQDAEFIAKNCQPGTKVKIYKSGERDDELRAILLQASYTGDNGQTYQDFLGIPVEDGALGMFSEGSAVTDLQLRLRDCGIYNGSIDGRYRTSTVEAVKAAQALLGVEQTGVASCAFQQILFSDNAPSDMKVSITEGMSGPAVRRLQEGLHLLGLYSGDQDGVYDIDVSSSVRIFQCAYGYEENGIASPNVQASINYEALKIRQMFSSATEYYLEKEIGELPIARVNCKIGVHLRENPTTDSKSLMILKLEDNVLLLQVNNEWCKVKWNNTIGYIKKMYLSYNPQSIVMLHYSSLRDNVCYSIGHTVDEYLAGEGYPALSDQKFGGI